MHTTMRNIYYLFSLFTLILISSACQDKDIEREGMKLNAIDEKDIIGELQGDNYIWTWPEQDNLQMQVTTYTNGTKGGTILVQGNSYTHTAVDTNIEYMYVFKLTDGSNYSTGIVKNYMRKGATQVTGVSMVQVDKPGGYDAKVEWSAPTDAENITFSATNGKRTITRHWQAISRNISLWM